MTANSSEGRLSVTAAATEAGVSVDTIRRAIRSGALRAFRPDGVRRIVILREDLLGWAFGEERAVSVVPPRVHVHPPAAAEAPALRARRRSRGADRPGSVARLLDIERSA